MIKVSIPKIKDESEIKERISQMSSDRLLAICNDIYSYKYQTGELAKDCEFRNFAKEIGYENYRILEEVYIMPEAFIRFKRIIPFLMLSNYGNRFLKHFGEE